MSTELYHQLNPYIRLKENDLLAPESFEQLIRAEDFQQISTILQPTVYGKYLTENFQNHFEDALAADRSATFTELMEMAPDPDVVWIYTMRYTFHNLKALTKAYYAEENYDHLFLPDGLFPLEDVKNAIQTGKSAILPAEVLAVIREVREYMAESKILQGIDVIYDRSYLDLQRTVAERIGEEKLLTEVISFIDLTNITIALRCVLQKRTANFMSAVLSDAGAIAKEDLVSYAEKDSQQLIQYLLETEYAEILAPALSGPEIDFAALDLLTDNHLTRQYSLAQTVAFGPLPLLAYLNAKDIERKNLRLIIVGKRNGFSNEQIQERMRETYDL